MKFEDKNGKILRDWDVIDLHQTVNGQNKFVVKNVEELSVAYHHNGEPYEYDVLSMLSPCKISGTVEWEIVGNMKSDFNKSLSKKNQITHFKSGAAIRLHNKRIAFQQTEEKTMVVFRFADENADVPACKHRCHKGKVRETFIQMSNEAMDALVMSYLSYKKKSHES